MGNLKGLNGGQASALRKAWEEADNLRTLANTVFWDDRQTQEEAADAWNRFSGLCARYGIAWTDVIDHFMTLGR